MLYDDQFNTLPDENILDLSKLEAHADDILKVTPMIILFYQRSVKKNLCAKEKMLVTSIFSFSHIVFRVFLSESH